MANKDNPKKKSEELASSALKVNLERTAATIEIPEQDFLLLSVVKNHYGLQKKTRELLMELHHPFVNWEYVLKELKSVSIGDFHIFNHHQDGLGALSIILRIYLNVIRSSAGDEVKDNAIHYLLDYMDTILTRSNERLARNMSLLPEILKSLLEIIDEDEMIFRKSSSYVKKIIKSVEENNLDIPAPLMADLIHRLFGITYRFRLSQPDPAEWFIAGDGINPEGFEAYRQIIQPLSHEHFRSLLEKLEELRPGTKKKNGKSIQQYTDLPDFFQTANGYLTAADQLEKSKAYQGHQHLVKLRFLFHVMDVASLADVHAGALREINYSLKKVFQEEKQESLDDFVRKIFGFLKKNKSQREFSAAIYDCITTTAKEVFAQNNHQLAETFIDELIAYGFQYPEIKGSTEEWQVRVNPAHIINIRAWLEIIGMKPRWTKRLISALIINLKMGGIFVRDTDLIQKDISALLNTDIAPAYGLIKQLLRIFPVYFKEIGAEGELRDISTKVDELSARQDKLVYFLRKQSHVESNSLLVKFIEDIFQYWNTGDMSFLRAHLPNEVYEQVMNPGEYFTGMHKAFKYFFTKVHGNPRKFLEWDNEKVCRELNNVKGVNERDQERVKIMIRIYQLVYKKYYPQYIDLLKDLEAVNAFPKADIISLKRALNSKNYFRSLSVILKFLSLLKEQILSPKKTQVYENIYYKRHIAAGIPSMYGTYYEKKFDAVGLTLRLESLATMLFEELGQSFNLKFITKQTIKKIHTYLWIYINALEIEGISTEGLAAKVKYVTNALSIKQFSLEQYVDIFRFISKDVQDIIRNYYIDVHASCLPVVIRQIYHREAEAEKKTVVKKQEKLVYQHSENFFRGIISSAFGIQVLDNFVNAVIKTLNAESDKFKDNKQILKVVMAYNPELTVSSFYKKNKKLDNQILLGNKGYFLKELVSFGFNVPPGFIITTEVFRGYEAVYGYKYIFNDLAVRVNKEIKKLEKITGRKLGDHRNPLLLSVRSGATVSLPGMMKSFLNVGINEAIAENLSEKENFRWAAWDSYRRFLQTWGMFQGMDRNFFDAIINEFKQKHGVERKIQFPPGQMKKIAIAYRNGLEDNGIEFKDKPLDQLRHAILQVFDSWYSEQAEIYRRQMHLSDKWGTAVIVQKMVFGNLNEHSGSGVIFTREPKSSSNDVTLYGDFIFGVQGDDIVSGLVETYPISKKQRIAECRYSEISLEEKFPEIYGELLRISEILIYEKGFNHQEIEFTFEGPTRDKLYILQTRDMNQITTQKWGRFKDSKAMQASVLGVGIGVNGGALAGRAVYSEADIRRFRETEPDTPLILIRPDTVPDDVGVLLQVEGLLTAKGGSTSHAAVTIPQLNKVGVVGFSKLKVYEADKFATIDDHTIRAGDFISIDGWSGTVYNGRHENETESQV
ncbi:MAG: PEP/pyruvate-binding domain-containing protein [Smithella sp.]|nr:PEP/pyruvate-binding domain-containing protein [Smithella sp.]